QKLAASEFEQGAALTVVEQNAVAPQRGAEQRLENGELVKFDGTGTVPIGEVTSSDYKLPGEGRLVGGSIAATYAAFDKAGNLFTNASDIKGNYQFSGRLDGARATIQDVLDNATDPQQRLELLKYRFERWNVGAGEYAALGLDLNPGDPGFTEMQQRANGMRDAVGSFSLMTAGGVAGLMTGGLAFGAVRTLGAPLATSAWGAIGVTGAAGVSAGFVGDLTSQGIENVAYFASGKTIGHFGIKKTELALSAGFGLAPILPSVIRQTAAEARAVGMPDWSIGFDLKPGTTLNGLVPQQLYEAVQLERIVVARAAEQEVFHNQLPQRLAEELAEAGRLGVRPIAPLSEGFDKIIEREMKFAVTQKGELRVMPKFAEDGSEISHAVLTNGKPVISAGEVDIAGDALNGYLGLGFKTHSGHFLNGATDAQNAKVEAIAREAFEKYGITF
ncbi:hypothetical protein SAMN05518865_1511, partial [Duganella sp. CF458]|uniref:hypothetical protein n=1 Tax=Duganella sp. CF458 TaxID=1884368 RepID=UPI0008E99253